MRDTSMMQTAHLVGRRVKVYRNLHLPGFYSVVSMSGDDYGRVIGYVTAITLRDVAFRVSESGRQRVITERRKNVHAFVVGIVESAGTDPTEEYEGGVGMDRVTYNPYRFGRFFLSASLNQAPEGVIFVERADTATISRSGVWIPTRKKEREAA